MQAYSGEEKPFLLEYKIQQGRGGSSLDTLKLSLSQKSIRDEFKRKEVMLSQISSLLDAVDIAGGIDYFIKSGYQNMIEITPELQSKLDQDQEMEIQITRLDLSNIEIGDELIFDLVEKLLHRLPDLKELDLMTNFEPDFCRGQSE